MLGIEHGCSEDDVDDDGDDEKAIFKGLKLFHGFANFVAVLANFL